MAAAEESVKSPATLAQIAKYFTYLGATGFGGPIALVAAMQRDLIDTKKWYSQDDFRRGMVLAQLSPGPMASQLAIYFGWVSRGWLGGLIAGGCLALPGLLIVILLAWLYITFSGFEWLHLAFRGAGPVILALIVRGAFKLWRTNTKSDPWLWAISLAAAVLTFIEFKQLLFFLLSSGLIYTFVRSKDRSTRFFSFVLTFLLAGQGGIASPSELLNLFGYFLKVGSTVFGSGLTIVPFLHSGVVNEYHWLTEQQFLDAVAVAMITPGPMVITVGFIGFFVAGAVGATLAAIGIFLPVYLITVIPARYFETWTKINWIRNLVTGFTAAAVGSTLGAAALIASQTLTNVTSIALLIVTATLLWLTKKIPEPVLILSAGLLGYGLGLIGLRI